jgi:hypothetical protein
MKNVTRFQIIDWDGKQITRPGIYANVPSEVYHRKVDLFPGPSISSGPLRRLEDPDINMEKFYLTYPGNPDYQPEPDKQVWVFGRAAHTLLLGESGFKEQYLIRPDTYPDDPTKPWHGSSNSCKKWLAEAVLDGKTVLTTEDIHNIRGMATKLAAHSTIQAGILNGMIEKSIFWRRRITLPDGRVVAIWLKARPDGIPLDSEMLVDLKSADNAGPLKTRKAIGDYGLHQQLALAVEGIKATTGRLMKDCVLVFQEKVAPWSINIKPIDPVAIEYGHRQNLRAMTKFAQALADNYWPGYEDDEVPASLPKWKLDQLAFEAEHDLLPAIDLNPDYSLAEDESEEAI